jgi:trans-2,3-dihydro-3-hydroxyanthranilate isomerase
MTAFEFAIVDVFADRPLAGNPLAVVHGGEDLPDTVLARIAREFNQSETTFVLPARRPGATRRLRSFTAGGAEVTGAGHNALGAWWWIVATGRERAGALTQELGGEVLDLTVHRDPDGLHVALRQGRPRVGAELDARAELARPLGVDPHRLVDRPAVVVSTGADHLLVQAADREAVDAARPDASDLAAALARAFAQGCYLFATTSGAAAYARFFNPTVGLWEDPATGSAAGPLAWWLTAGDARRHTVEIEQGHAMGRPSRLAVEVDGDDVTLVGSATLVADGRLHLDGVYPPL